MKSNWDQIFNHSYRQLQSGKSAFVSSQIRDLTKIELGNKYALIIAVDSDGGIGSLPLDVIHCGNYQLGRFAMRVPLMEIVACGAAPLAAFDMLTLPMDELGKEIIRGVRDELASAGLDENFPLSGSTEDNIPTQMTGIGTTVIGLVHDSDFRPGTSRSGDYVVCVGKPKSGPQDMVLLDDPEIISQPELRKLISIKDIHDVLPVGSHGVRYELQQMADSAGLIYALKDSVQIDLLKSAGPATCVLVSSPKSGLTKMQKNIRTPVFVIAQLSRR